MNEGERTSGNLQTAEFRGADKTYKLDVRNVRQVFESSTNAVVAITDVSLQVGVGDVVALIGPTGCGKSTLLNLLAGFDLPSAGEVLMDGSPIVRAEPGRGVLLQNLGLFPWLTVERNMRFGADIMDRAKGKVGKKQGGREPTDARVEAYLNELGLSSARKRFPHQISGGMQARTAIGRLLVANPGVLLLDEPFGSLDALTRASLHKLLLHIIKQEEKTVVFITHDIDEAIVLADRICVFSPAPGTIVAELTVPFGREREYEDVVQSEVVVELRREALSHLRVE